MSFIDLSRERRSVRTFEERAVEQDKIDLILEAGRIAPTAANKQPQRIYVLRTEEAMTKAREAAGRMMHNATTALLVCYDSVESWKATNFGEPDYDGGEVDAAIVTTAMMMEATDLGVGTLWVRGFNAPRAAKIFELPPNIHPVCFLVLGYPTEAVLAKPHTPRKELSETVTVL
ncbi:MAG: nitroreductase family protein [Atopobiaceae bacterium]|nr:nitroreductase family protein [Atopobiaceae bacterium]